MSSRSGDSNDLVALRTYVATATSASTPRTLRAGPSASRPLIAVTPSNMASTPQISLLLVSAVFIGCVFAGLGVYRWRRQLQVLAQYQGLVACATEHLIQEAKSAAMVPRTGSGQPTDGAGRQTSDSPTSQAPQFNGSSRDDEIAREDDSLDPVPPQAVRIIPRSKLRIAVVSLNAVGGKATDTSDSRSLKGTGANGWKHRVSYHNKAEYCKKWGYDLIIEDDSAVNPTRDVVWSKIPVLQKWLPHYDWVMWMDMDALFMKFETRLEDIVASSTKHIIITKDWHGINMGVFFLKNSEVVKSLLDDIWKTPQTFWYPHLEQSALSYLVDYQRQKKKARERLKHFHFPPQRLFNSYPQQFAYGNRDSQYESGDFIAHFANCHAFPNCRDTFVQFASFSDRSNGLQALPATDTVPARVIPAVHASTTLLEDAEDDETDDDEEEDAGVAEEGLPRV